jgi:hypothetical protein
MATKKTEKAAAPKAASKTTATKAPKAAKAAKAPAAKTGPRHPHGRVSEGHGGKEALAKSLAAVIARADEDKDQLTTKLKTASNQQLLRLQRVAETVKKKWGGRDKLIAAIGSAQNKSKDKDFIAKLESFSLPQLLDIATSGERRART